VVTAGDDDILGLQIILRPVGRAAARAPSPFKDVFFILHDLEEIRHIPHFYQGFQFIDVNDRRLGVRSQKHPLVSRGVQVPGLVRIMPKPPFHVPGVRFGDAGHQFLVFARVVQDLRDQINQVLDRVFLAAVRFPLHLFLGLVIVLLHKHEYRTDTGQPGGDKGHWIEQADGHAQARGGQEILEDAVHRIYLLFQAEFLDVFLGRLDLLVQAGNQGVDGFRLFVGHAHVVFVLAWINHDGFFGAQIVPQ